ncbi:hydrolase [Lactobacillus sp. CBA3606]|uniref:alpha/beta hydrolase n=1 Tax=Lactobacillus sp. CBA3606 TaxID=2099789 RepID=UPI000CFB5C52|nr:alpha/beta hydrolase [Lactobacillus sp. CBA3606]AVK63492.1 hydrolase [Lactobacillus sp. CBA3606]
MTRKKIIWLMAIMSSLVVTGSGAYWHHRLAPLRSVKVQTTNIPTVFIAGDYARAFSTNGFVHRLSAAHLATKALVVNVGRHGQVHVHQFAPLRHNPTIQVVFADNHQPKRQARQLVSVMRLLKQRYHVYTYNAVGHSSGGNIIFDYLTHPSKQQPKINKFVTIASTYPQATTAIKRLPAKLPILTIAGHVWQSNGDGTVKLKAVLAFNTALRHQGRHPQTKLIQGSPLTAAHSMLHINPTVDRAVITFLYH